MNDDSIATHMYCHVLSVLLTGQKKKKKIFILRKINGLVFTTFTLEQKSVFKLERNKDLTFIVIIIDIDWYEKNYRDNFFGPYRPALVHPNMKIVLICSTHMLSQTCITPLTFIV